MKYKTGERVSQMGRISLRFQCESRFEIYPQNWGNSLRMVYVLLHAPTCNKKHAHTGIQIVPLDDTFSEVETTCTTSEVATSKANKHYQHSEI